MNWRDFVHDHAIAVIVGVVAFVLVLSWAVLAALPSRGHVLRLLFGGLTWIALLLGAGVISSSLNLLPDIGIASRDTTLLALAGAELAVIALMWRVGAWWAEHIDRDRADLAKRLKDAQAPVSITLTPQKVTPETKA